MCYLKYEEQKLIKIAWILYQCMDLVCV